MSEVVLLLHLACNPNYTHLKEPSGAWGGLADGGETMSSKVALGRWVGVRAHAAPYLCGFLASCDLRPFSGDQLLILQCLAAYQNFQNLRGWVGIPVPHLSSPQSWICKISSRPPRIRFPLSPGFQRAGMMSPSG